MLNWTKCELSLASIQGNMIIIEDALKYPRSDSLGYLLLAMYLPWTKVQPPRLDECAVLCQPELSQTA